MGNVVDSSGKPILDSSGKPIKTGSAAAAKVSKSGSTSGADILTPEQKKYFSSMDTNQSVFTEAEIDAVRAGGDESLARTMEQQNEDAIAALGENADNDPASTPFERATSDSSDPIIRPPTRAQDTYTFRQAPAVLMTGAPRLKFEYVAAFRFSGTDLFETIFSDEIAESLDNLTNETWPGSNNVPPSERGLSQEEKKKRLASSGAAQKNKQQTLDAIRRSLMFNVKSIDGPKVNFQYDTLNQYNRKRNVYRRVDYDPINVVFHDTMNNSALKFWKYLYELNLKDGRNKSPAYAGDMGSSKQTSRSPYQPNSLTTENDFISDHNFGLESSLINHTYPIKSLDLFIVHARKYNLIRFIHPKVIAMQHDLFSYESSQPIEIALQFAYETVIYETLNTPFDASQQDISVDLNQIFETAEMPDPPTTAKADDEGSDGTAQQNYDWTKLTASSVGAETSAATARSGSNVMGANSFSQAVNQVGAAFGGSILNGTPVSDAISAASKEVYSTTKSAVSSFLGGGKSGGGNNFNFAGGLGEHLSGLKGPGDGRYNPDSKNFQKPNLGYVKDSKGKIIKDSNGNAVRGGTYKDSDYVDDYE